MDTEWLKRAIREGITDPTASVRYLRRRITDRRAGYITFDHETIGSSTHLPSFCHELYLDSKLIARMLEKHIAPRSLEVGCGYGRLTPWIAEHSDEHYGVDPNSELLADARTHYPDVTFRESLAEELPFPDDFFDLVVTWRVLMHIPPPDIRTAVDELCRVTGPDGIIVVSETVHGLDMPRVFLRPVDEWIDLFAPYELVDCVEREAEPFHDEEHRHIAMKFVCSNEYNSRIRTRRSSEPIHPPS